MRHNTTFTRFIPVWPAGALALLWLLAPVRGLAQNAGSATITGTVTDASGAVVPAAGVTVRNTDTGIERKTQTSDAGLYSAAFLPPGHYEVEAGKTGFDKVLRKELILQVGQTMQINLSLAVRDRAAGGDGDGRGAAGGRGEDRGFAGGQRGHGGQPADFGTALGHLRADDAQRHQRRQFSGLVSYRGISGLYNSNTVDGANNNQAFFSEARGRANSGAYVYSLDSIAEYQVTSSNYSAELGQAAGGVVNAVTKSGSNDFHGDLFYYLRYPTWNALDSLPEIARATTRQPIHQWQQFGASVGGPFIKEKLFFFMTYDGSRKVNPMAYTSSTYTPTYQGDPVHFAAGVGHPVRGGQRVSGGRAGHFPARHRPERGIRQAGLPGDRAQPPERLL